MKYHVSGLGMRNLRTEFSEVVWFIEQRFKNRPIRMKTKYLLDFYFDTISGLFKKECYEVLGYLRFHLSDDQIKTRIKWNLKQEEKRKEELEKWKRWKENKK